MHVTLPPLLDPKFQPSAINAIVEEAIDQAIPEIAERLKGESGFSRVPVDTGKLRSSLTITEGLGRSRFRFMVTMWWDAEYASYLIEHAGDWRAHAAGTQLDWRPWATQVAQQILEDILLRLLIHYGYTAELKPATRGPYG